MKIKNKIVNFSFLYKKTTKIQITYREKEGML